jgi:hypothetical protein
MKTIEVYIDDSTASFTLKDTLKRIMEEQGFFGQDCQKLIRKNDTSKLWGAFIEACPNIRGVSHRQHGGDQIALSQFVKSVIDNVGERI